MSFLKLQNLGKIYVSDSNISVGIRGINLEFDVGEFVAVTGESGSGKSTLLNVISGMDSYEEGELFVEGAPTSHYIQADWEEYREKYISFIFQDYNIVDSFTVLENVELALLHIEDPRERRRRAIELLERVGLSGFLHQRGSKLSGGQKQRTVIARALAKDSPIILADEPTGNLDSASSREIMELLHEVSGDKLVIVVTHDFAEIEPYATRHIRIYDGAVEYDRTMAAPQPHTGEIRLARAEAPTRGQTLRQGMTLGRVRFRSMPKLTVFLCLLMIIAGVGLFIVTSFCGRLLQENESDYMFRHIDGRLLVVRRDGAPMTEAEKQEILSRTGASSLMRFDFLLDQADYEYDFQNWWQFGYAHDFDLAEGRWPETADEVALRVPLSAKRKGSDYQTLLPVVLGGKIWLNGTSFTITGITYVADNTKPLLARFSENGFLEHGYLYYIDTQMGGSLMLRTAGVTEEGEDANTYEIGLSYGGFYLIESEEKVLALPTWQYEEYASILKRYFGEDKGYAAIRKDLSVQLRKNSYGYGPYDRYAWEVAAGTPVLNLTITLDSVLSSDTMQTGGGSYYNGCGISTGLLREIMAGYAEQYYTQVSLFFANDAAARKGAQALDASVYFTVLSQAKEEQLDNVLTRFFSVIGNGLLWLGTVVFLILFVSLSSSKAMMATRGDLAIMRSMGIRVPVIRLAVYMQMLLTLIPTLFVTAGVALTIYLTPVLNAAFTFLHAPGYLLLFAGLLLVAVLVARRHVKKLYRQSVKKTMKAGDGA